MGTNNQTHTYQDIEFDLGETWTIKGTMNKDNAPLVVDSNTIVELRIASTTKGLILMLSLTADEAITDIPTAAFQIVIPPSEQTNTTNLIPGSYQYELSATLGDGTITIQSEGKCIVKPSLRYRFPTQ